MASGKAWLIGAIRRGGLHGVLIAVLAGTAVFATGGCILPRKEDQKRQKAEQGEAQMSPKR